YVINGLRVNFDDLLDDLDDSVGSSKEKRSFVVVVILDISIFSLVVLRRWVGS
ncbi:hypothetical protein Csa_007108, partial [Cucumis sativus]